MRFATIFALPLAIVTMPLAAQSASEAAPAKPEAKSAPFVQIKRPALWVPDLDRAILFYRDVLGFTLYERGTLELKEDSVLLDLFNMESAGTVRRALFSSSNNERALFVMESKDAPRYSAGDKRGSTQVIQVDDIEAVKKRARKHGFTVGNSNREPMRSGGALLETTLIGPGGQSTLIYQFAKQPDDGGE